MSKKSTTKLLANKFEEEKVAELAEVDDWSSAWEDCKASGEKWGGRGRGGRAAGRMTVQTRDVVLEGVTLSYLGNDLLDRTTLRLLHGRRYGLIGRNGVGKSTLMSRISTGTLPGFPPHLRVAQVSQELPLSSDPSITPVDFVIQSDPDRAFVQAKIDELEAKEDHNEADADLLCSLYEDMEEEGNARARAIKVLRDLGFSEQRRSTPMGSLSGGWRMRVSIASALSQEPNVLLLDEPTNHLDLEGIEWLKAYLKEDPQAQEICVLVTSHDRFFLDDVCTDIIRFHRRQLHYYPGNFTDFETAYNDKELHNQRQQENIDKKREKLEESIRKMQITASKSATGAMGGQVSSRKKKLDRHGAEKNEKGFRFRVQQDSYNGMSAIRAGSRNEIALGAKTGESRSLTDLIEKPWSVSLPPPTPLPTSGPYAQLRSLSIGYDTSSTPTPPSTTTEPSTSLLPPTPPSPSPSSTSVKAVRSLGSKKALSALSAKANSSSSSEGPPLPSSYKTVLQSITMNIESTSKIAILGKNGSGKTTLFRMIQDYGEEGLPPSSSRPIVIGGRITKSNNLKISYFQQHQQDVLPYDLSSLEHLSAYAETLCRSSSLSSALIEGSSSSPSSSEYSEQNLRAHLGAFGLSGELALRKIGVLSGGQKTRLVLAQLTLTRPHILLLDEPTNNLDADGIRALGEAIQEYTGAVIIASHDMSFVAETCSPDQVFMIADKEKSLVRLEGGVDEYVEQVKESVRRKKQILKASETPATKTR